MRNLDAALQRAVSLREDLDETKRVELDLGYGGRVLGWPKVPRASIFPRDCRGSKRWIERLGVALNILGLGINVTDKGCQLFYREWGDNGLWMPAIALRDAFQAGVLGPKERVATTTLHSIAEYLKPLRSKPEQMLAVRLEDIGFVKMGERQCLRGADRVILPDGAETLKLTGKKFLPLAPDRFFAGDKHVEGDEILATHFPGFLTYRSSAQREVVHELCDPNGSPAVIARLPTGGGKWLCYFLAAAHALSEGRPHTAVVVSPIVALQNDQILQVANKLNPAKGGKLEVAQINMTVPLEGRSKIYSDLFRGKLHVLFLSPEKLLEPFFR